MLVATMIAGIAAYVVTWLVPRQVGFAGYTVFAVFWSFMYLVVGTLGGIQQEVTRGTSRVAIADVSKNLYATFQASQLLGLEVVQVVDARPAFCGSTYRRVPVLSEIQRVDGVINVIADRLEPLPVITSTRSRDFR